MFHTLPLISTLAAAFGLSLIFGFLVSLINLPLIVGYLLAGIVIGPFTPGMVANVAIAKELSEVGVMLLMFGVGLQFSVEDLLKVKKIALPGAILQIAVATLIGGVIAHLWGWSIEAAFIFGLALSVASTVVMIRALESQGILNSMDGRIALGWLIVEDMVMVIMLVMLPALSPGLGTNVSLILTASFWIPILITLGKAICFILFMFFIARPLFPKILLYIDKRGSRELFTLAVIAAAISIAYFASKVFGVSFALGAFFAGMMMRGSTLSHRAAEESLPLRDAFSVLFFVSVGMLCDPSIIIHEPLKVLIVLAIILFGKTAAAALLVWLLRYPLSTALTVSVSLAQVGEFSFILAALGVQMGILPGEGQNLILAGALISIALNPLLFKLVGSQKKRKGEAALS
jgi:CPA2 family monovalent cation:H+ antiporter-2